MTNPNKKPLTVQTVLKQLLCLFLSLIVLAPLYLVVINSFKTKSEAARMNLSLPTQWVFSNYPDVFKKANLLTGLGNSLLYAQCEAFAMQVSELQAFCLQHASISEKMKALLDRMRESLSSDAPAEEDEAEPDESAEVSAEQ